MTELLRKGDRVVLNNREGSVIYGTFSHIHPTKGYAYIRGEDGKSYERHPSKIRKTGDAVTDFHVNNPDNPDSLNRKLEAVYSRLDAKASANAAATIQQQYDIDQRFNFLEKTVRMVLKKTTVSMIITGEGGLGKTYTVLREVHKKGLTKDIDFIHIKGYSTPKGLYKTLYENSDKLIIFDDCDNVLKDEISKNILKSALDSYDERTIHWISTQMGFNNDLPPYFEFSGYVIFISNMNQDRIDQAILSRSTTIDVTMSSEDKIRRMTTLLPEIKKSVPMEQKQECLDLINEHKEECKDLNLRTLIKVINIRTDEENGDDWKDMAIYQMVYTNS